MAKSDYSYWIEESVLCIADLDQGRMSVTNDIENVIREIYAERPDLIPFPAVYCDSQGLWDGLAVKDGKFHTFVPINCESLPYAIERIKAIAPGIDYTRF